MPRTPRQEKIRILRAIDKHALTAYDYAISMRDNANMSGHGEIAHELNDIMDMLATVRLKSNHCINIINGLAH